MSFSIQPLSRSIVKSAIQDFIKLSKDNIADEYWDEENFLKELNRKWELSYFVTDNTDIKGFLIASEKAEGIHIHKFVVDFLSQRKGLGSLMLVHFLTRIDRPVMLKVRQDNDLAIKFYSKNGFIIEQQTGESYTMIRT